MDVFTMIKKGLEPKIKGKDLTLESTFKDLGLDSIDLVDLVFQFEEELGIEFEDEELTSLKTVGDVVSLIESKQ